MEVTITDAKTQIIELEEQLMAAINAGNGAAAVDAFYADDAVFMPNHGPNAVGKEQIKGAMAGMAEMGLKSLQLTTGDVFVSGDVAWNHGTFEIVIATPGGDITDTGPFVTIFRRQDDGSLKCVTDIFNSDHPMPA